MQTLSRPSYTNRDGSTSEKEHESIFILASTQSHVGHYALEIGTLYGDRTSLIARALPEHTILTVDIPPNSIPILTVDQEDTKYFYRQPSFENDVSNRIKPLYVDSYDLCLPDGTDLGFAFIDGAHSYEYAFNDFRKCVHYSADTALIMFHDFGGWPGVTRCVEELCDLLPDWQWKRLDGTSLVWCKVNHGTRNKVL